MSIIVKNGIVTGIFILTALTGCKHAAPVYEKTNHSTVPVKVSSVRTGKLETYMELNATSVFLFKASVKTPVTGYVENILINQGDRVEKNQILFKIKTKEANSLSTDSLNNMGFSGIVSVKSAASGIVSSVGHSFGDYIAESDELCQISIPGSFVFILDVPFELSDLIRLNASCDIALPDSEVIKGIIRSRLPAMAGNSQTERYIVRLAKPKNLPENLSVKIRMINKVQKEAVSLPKSAILTDETMKSFWVMKVVNDSMAVKVPVTTGISTEEYIQITGPVFLPSDLFLTSNNYGLGDTVYVRILKTTGDGQ
jgi:multidrug efflux pump subunit AcrA (membrane-fusion protein)